MSKTLEQPTAEPEDIPLGMRRLVAERATHCCAFLRSRWAVLSTVGTSFAVFATFALQGILLARILGPQGRGEYGTVVFYPQTLIYIGTVGTLYSIARRAGNMSDQLPSLGRAAVRLGSVTGVMTMVIAGVLAFVALPPDRQYLVPLCLVASLLLPFEHMRLMLLAVDHGGANFARYNLCLLFSALALPLLLGITWGIGAESTALVVVLTWISSAFGLAFVLLRRREPIFGPSTPSVFTLIREGTPFAASVVASDLFNRLDRLLIIWLASLTKQGYYAAALAAANLLLVAPNALALFSFNWGVRQKDSSDLQTLLRNGAAVVLFQIVTALAFAAVLPMLMILVFGESFREAIPVGMALLPAIAIAGFSHVAEGFLRGQNKAMIGVWARIAGAVVLVGSALLLRPAWDVFAVPMAVAAGNATCALWITWAVLHDVGTGQVTES